MKIILLMNLKTIFSIWLKRSVNVLNTKVLTFIGVVVVNENLQLNLKRTHSPVFFKGLTIGKNRKFEIEIKKAGKVNPEKYEAAIKIDGDYIGSLWFDKFEMRRNVLCLFRDGDMIAGFICITEEHRINIRRGE